MINQKEIDWRIKDKKHIIKSWGTPQDIIDFLEKSKIKSFKLHSFFIPKKSTDFFIFSLERKVQIGEKPIEYYELTLQGKLSLFNNLFVLVDKPIPKIFVIALINQSLLNEIDQLCVSLKYITYYKQIIYFNEFSL